MDPEEEQFLRDHFPTKGAKWCARHLHMKPDTLRKRAYTLGLHILPSVKRAHMAEAQERKYGHLPWHSSEWLVEHYVRNGLPAAELARMAETNPKRILKWIDRFGIERHPRKPKTVQGIWRNRRWLKRAYIDEQRSVREVARIAGTGSTIIGNWLKKFGFKIRPKKGSKLGPKVRARISQAKQKWWDEHPERRVEMGENQRGENNRQYGTPPPVGSGTTKWIQHENPDGQLINLQGSFEKRFAEALDKAGIRYISHKGMRRFSYEIDGASHTYGPDFYVPAWDTYYEIKGYFTPEAQRKWQAVIKTHPYIQFELVQEQLLEEAEGWASNLCAAEKLS